jgi:hypothetical protein
MTVHFNEENFPLFKGRVRSTQARLQIICQISEAFLLAGFFENSKLHTSPPNDQTTRMEKDLEGLSSPDDEVRISETSPATIESASNEVPVPPDHDETYPPTREVVTIMCALGSAMFLVGLVGFFILPALIYNSN